MKNFINLFTNLDETNKTNSKIDALVNFFDISNAEDCAWAISFLIGRKPKQLVPTKLLREWAAEIADIPDWLFEESYERVGDLAETMALVMQDNELKSDEDFSYWVKEILLPLKGKDEITKKEIIISTWNKLNKQGKFVWNKLITGGFRVGVSKKIVIKALARHTEIDESVVAHRLMGNWSPSEEFYLKLISKDTEDTEQSTPYPFYLAYPLEANVNELGTPNEWIIEWKWDGIRSQIIKRNDEVYIWSRGEEMVNENFPELTHAAMQLPNGTVIDAEIVPWKKDKPMDFGELQKRIGRKTVSKNIMNQVPVKFVCFDILEFKGNDIREIELQKRKEILKYLLKKLNSNLFILSETLDTNTWEDYAERRKSARENGVEGFMIKRANSAYKVGRIKGDWWKWKIDPLTIDAVMIYAQRGHGRRASLYTDYTFAVKSGKELIPFAKAYSGLTDDEIRKVDRFVRSNTKERFGPVRSVKPELVFEIAFEGIRESNRHKSGVAVRFPRINKWRNDKNVDEINSLDDLKDLIQ